MKKHFMRKLIFVFLAIAVFSFLGIPVPEWVERIVELIVSFFTGIIDFILKILSLVKILSG